MKRQDRIGRVVRSLAAAVLLLGAAAGSRVLAADKLGVVLMHGKHGLPEQLALYDAPLASLGILTARPEMCWSRHRIYDRPYLDCLREVDDAIANLKARGATAIVVGGMSLGGNGALGYGAHHQGLKGILTLAPAHFPEFLSRRPDIEQALERARQLLANGHGGEKVEFPDINQNEEIKVVATPAAYISFLGADSPSVMPRNAATLSAPLLLVAGIEDRSQRGESYVFGRAPGNPLNRYVTVHSNHFDTPAAGREAAIAWLRELQKR